jgi:CRISPR-associated endonuclease/helicase Cas3
VGLKARHPNARHSPKALRWRGAENARQVRPERIRPGDTIVVPASYGGADAYGWNPKLKTTVSDVTDACLTESIASYPGGAFRRPKLRVRLHPRLLPDADEATRQKWLVLLESAVAAADADNAWPLIQRMLRAMRSHLRSPAVDALLAATERPRISLYPDGSGLVLSGSFRLPPGEVSGPTSEDGIECEEPEDDEASFSQGGCAVELSTHGASVAQAARDFASRCGLSAEFTEALGETGSWHDQGKRDPRFQAWLHGSELKALAAIAKGQFLAKSGRDPDQWQSSEGYPRGLAPRIKASPVRMTNAEVFSGRMQALLQPDLKMLADALPEPLSAVLKWKLHSAFLLAVRPELCCSQRDIEPV